MSWCRRLPDSFDSNTVAQLTARLRALQRTLEMRRAELEEAHRHIAALEEKLLKLKEYRLELKRLKEERQRLRKSAERRVGQVLLAACRLPTRLAKKVRAIILQCKSFSRARWFLARNQRVRPPSY